jgi:predicted GNAT superfamily acetyltransferase
MGNQKIHWAIKILETVEEITAVEGLQRIVWPGSETEIVPVHLLVTAAHNGGLVIGAFLKSGSEIAPEQETFDPAAPPIGFVFGFPGLYFTPDGPRPKHCSHMLGVHPDYRNQGIGFALKRAQWQMVRHQGIDRITWTYDPLLSRNAHLNITRLGAVCSTYRKELYGEMSDGLNIGVPSDRFEVDWWVNSTRVYRRLSRRPRLALDLAHFLAGGAVIVNPSQAGPDQWPRPALSYNLPPVTQGDEKNESFLLVEIPADFLSLKTADLELANEWRKHTRGLFETLFAQGYLVTDFIFLPGSTPRAFYVLSHGNSTL